MTHDEPTIANYWRLAEQCRIDSDWPGATDNYRAIVARDPSHLPALLRLSDAYAQTNRYRDALTALLAAADVPVGQDVLLFSLLQRLRGYVEIEATLRCAQEPALRDSQNAGILATVGSDLTLLGELELARQYIESAMKIVGSDAPLLYSRARIHEFAGDFGAAEADLRQALSLDPDDSFSHWSLSRLPADCQRGEDIDALLAALRRLGPDGKQSANIQFALFNRLDRQGDVAAAWRYLDSANQAMRPLVRYDPGRSEQLFKKLRECPWANVPSTSQAGASGGPVPVFIVGLHRSGTTLLESLLCRSSDVARGGELYDFPAQLRWACDFAFPGATSERAIDGIAAIDFAMLGKRYLQHVGWRAGGKKFITDKLPLNFLNVGFVLKSLPEARILHVARGPMATCFSNFKEIFSGVAGYSYDQLELADYYAGYAELMEHWHRLFPERILTVDYAQMVTQPDETLARVAAFLGESTSSPSPDLSRGDHGQVVTSASSVQVRTAIHRRGIDGWRTYAAYLQPLRARLYSHNILD